jgi:hypothetical protein
MTKKDKQDALAALLEVRREISRVNIAAGHTVFNPAAKGALEGLIDKLAGEVAA